MRTAPRIPDDVRRNGGWNDGRRLARFLFKVAEAARYKESKDAKAHPEWMKRYRYAWQGRGGFIYTGPELPPNWPNPYWEIREKFGDMVMVWGEDVVAGDQREGT